MLGDSNTKMWADIDRVKRTQQLAYVIFSGTGFVLGILAGIISMNLIVSYKIDEFHKQIHHLESIVDNREVRLKKLEESINHRRYLIKNVKIHLEFEGDNIERLSIENALKDMCNILLGKEVKAIDLDLVVAMIDKRIVHLHGNEYRANVNRLVIAEVIQIWIVVQRM